MKIRATQKQKTLRAFGAYLELLDTVAWLKSWMKGPLDMFDLTMQGFRLLMLLYRNGPTPMMDAAKEMRFARQNLECVASRLEKRGWVCRQNINLPAAGKRTPEQRDRRRVGRKPARRMGILELTPTGEKFVGQVFPQQAKVAKALMRALDGREQETLTEICQKLRAGHIVKFLSEISHVDVWDEEEMGIRRRKPEQRGIGAVLRPRAAAPQNPKEALLRSLTPQDHRLLARIAETMQSRDIVQYARNVHWNSPPERERDSKTAVDILMRIGNERERTLLERMTRAMPAPEIIEFLKRMSEPVATE